MKKLATIVVMLCSVLAWGGVAPNPADYNINVHVSSSGTDICGSRLKVILDGKKCELESVDGSRFLVPGDYKAKTLPTKDKDVRPYDVYGSYEFLLPDGRTHKYRLVGMTE